MNCNPEMRLAVPGTQTGLRTRRQRPQSGDVLVGGVARTCPLFSQTLNRRRTELPPQTRRRWVVFVCAVGLNCADAGRMALGQTAVDGSHTLCCLQYN